jgi:hypothetical protein
MSMKNEFDALLYLGRPGTITYAPLAATLCRDTAYMKVRLWRLGLTGGSEEEIGHVKRECAAR